MHLYPRDEINSFLVVWPTFMNLLSSLKRAQSKRVSYKGKYSFNWTYLFLQLKEEIQTDSSLFCLFQEGVHTILQ